MNSLEEKFYPQAFNNLCLISNWLFRCKPYQLNIKTAFLGYSSKISHLFPLLQHCFEDGHNILFSDLQPICHGTSNDSWPKAATWYEMTMTLSSFSGFIYKVDRLCLIRLICFYSN